MIRGEHKEWLFFSFFLFPNFGAPEKQSKNTSQNFSFFQYFSIENHKKNILIISFTGWYAEEHGYGPDTSTAEFYNSWILRKVGSL